jgi:hypothetical protein
LRCYTSNVRTEVQERALCDFEALNKCSGAAHARLRDLNDLLNERRRGQETLIFDER